MFNFRIYRFLNVSRVTVGEKEVIIEATDRINHFSISPNCNYIRLKGRHVTFPKRLEREVFKNKGKQCKVRLRIDLKTRNIRLTSFLN